MSAAARASWHGRAGAARAPRRAPGRRVVLRPPSAKTPATFIIHSAVKALRENVDSLQISYKKLKMLVQGSLSLEAIYGGGSRPFVIALYGGCYIQKCRFSVNYEILC